MNRSIAQVRWSLAALLIVLSQLAAISAPAAPAPPAHVFGTVVTPGGKPVAGAPVIYDRFDFVTKKVIDSQTGKTDAQGKFDFESAGQSGRIFPILYASTPDGVAVSSIQTYPLTLTLEPFTKVHVRFVGTDGKPVSGLTVAPLFLRKAKMGAIWNASVSAVWSAVTDANGGATFSNLPQGYDLVVSVADSRYVQPQLPITLANAPLTPDHTIPVGIGGTISGTIRYGAGGKPAAGIRVTLEPGSGGIFEENVTDAEGKYHVARLLAGTYVVNPQLTPAQAADWIPAETRLSVSVAAGKDTAAPPITLVHGAIIEGIVTDKATGKPLPGIEIMTGGSGERAVTGSDGRYRLRVPAGGDELYVYSPRWDVRSGSTPPSQEVTAAEGDVKTVNFNVPAPPPHVTVQGIVIGADGKPAAGASVTVAGVSQRWDITAGADGHFTLDRDDVTAASKLYARLGDLATRTAVTPAAKGDTVLHLAAGALSTIRGQVVDAKHKPIANAKVMIFDQNVSGPGDATKTDSQGRYEFPGRYGDAQYMTMASAKNYTQVSSNKAVAAAGVTLELKPVILAKADSFIGGTVVDPRGKPVAGATVRVVNVDNLQVSTNKAGRFHLAGVPNGHAIVEVQAPGNRFASIEEPSGVDTDVITVRSTAEEMAEGKKFGEKMDADKTNHGDGSNAYALLASAEKRAAAGGKRVLLVFHASWCGPCFILHRFLEDPKVKPIINKHFVVQDVDIWEKGDKKTKWENPGGTDLYKHYNGPNSVPYFVILGKSGNKLSSSMHHGQNMGMPSEPDDVSFFLSSLKSAAPSLTAQDLTALRGGMKRANAIF